MSDRYAVVIGLANAFDAWKHTAFGFKACLTTGWKGMEMLEAGLSMTATVKLQ